MADTGDCIYKLATEIFASHRGRMAETRAEPKKEKAEGPASSRRIHSFPDVLETRSRIPQLLDDFFRFFFYFFSFFARKFFSSLGLFFPLYSRVFSVNRVRKRSGWLFHERVPVMPRACARAVRSYRADANGLRWKQRAPCGKYVGDRFHAEETFLEAEDERPPSIQPDLAVFLLECRK